MCEVAPNNKFISFNFMIWDVESSNASNGIQEFAWKKRSPRGMFLMPQENEKGA
jgi:hypothetical protein